MKFSYRNKVHRTPTEIPEKLRAHLTAYALSAGAAGVALLASTVTADAAPVCTQSTVVLPSTQSFPLNPAEQEIAPFNVAEVSSNVSSLTCCYWNRGFLTPNVPGAGNLLAANGFPSAVASGASIGPGGQFGEGQWYGLLFSFGPLGGGTKNHHRGNFVFGQDNYFGFEFPIAGKTHYGWMKVKLTHVRTGDGIFGSLHILEYAYETEPDTAILAGSCSNAETANAPQPTSLGALALGAKGIPLWRKVSD